MVSWCCCQNDSQGATFSILYRSTTTDSWSGEQLKSMMLGGNNRTQGFFKQYGWTNAGNIKAKYTSTAAYLYRQILAKEVAEDIGKETTTGLPEASSYAKEDLPAKDNLSPTHEAVGSTSSPKASYTVVPSTFTKPVCVRTRTTGGLGAQKLLTKVCLVLFFFF